MIIGGITNVKSSKIREHMDPIKKEKGISYYGSAPDLSLPRFYITSASNRSYSIFAGGRNNPTSYSTTVDCYDEELTHTSAGGLSQGRNSAAAAGIDDYVVVAGGSHNNTTGGYSNVVDAYDTSLTRTSLANLSQARSNLSGDTVGYNMIFAGGSGNSIQYTSVDIYDSTLTRTTGTSLTTTRSNLASASNDSTVLFAGGVFYNSSANQNQCRSTVDGYNESLTRITVTELSIARMRLGGANNGSYFIFAGGYTSVPSDTYYSTVDAYDENLTRSNGPSLAAFRYNLGSVGIGPYALFAGGTGNTVVRTTLVDIFDDSLTHTIDNIPTGRESISGTKIYNYALFAGGIKGSVDSSDVDVYKYTA